MGQLLSSLAWPPSPEPQHVPLLLQQPPEILLEVASHLDPVSATAFSLAGKFTYVFLFASARRRLGRANQEREALLLLLEKDPAVGDHLYYCDICGRLHYFSPWWGTRWRLREPPLVLLLIVFDDGSGGHIFQKFQPIGSDLVVSYHHDRLVMNRHLYGGSHGLPLTQLKHAQVRSRHHMKQAQRMKAREIGNELFLFCTATLTPSRPSISAQAFRAAVDEQALCLCPHVCTHSASYYPSQIPETASTGDGSSPGGEFYACRGAASSCASCLSDFETTVEREGGEDGKGAGQAGGGWSITVRSYHQLGKCRPSLDPVWMSFTDILIVLEDQRNLRKHPRGAVRRRWVTGDARSK